MTLQRPPTRPLMHKPSGVGLSVKDGWNLGIGFGLSLIIAVPIILIIFSCFIFIVIVVFGTTLTGLLGGFG